MTRAFILIFCLFVTGVAIAASQKLSQFPSAATPLTGAEPLLCLQSSADTQCLASSVSAAHADFDSVTTSAQNFTTTTFAAITGLTSGTLAASKAYAFELELFVTANGSGAGGIKIDFGGGSATATTLIGQVKLCDGMAIDTNTQIAALSSSVGNTSAVTEVNVRGTLITSAGGTLIPRAAQNAASGTSTIGAGSRMIIRPLN